MYLSPAKPDEKTDRVTDLMQIMLDAMEQIPGYQYGLISFGVDNKAGTVGRCSQKQITVIIDSLLAELPPPIAVKYLISRVDALKEAIIEVMRERGMPDEN
jgi:hypothetical protein